jgi:hypothetical protein
MAIRIRIIDNEPVFLETGIDREFIDLAEGDTFDMPDDFPEEYQGKYIVEKLIRDDSPLDNLGDIFVIKRI